MAKETKRDRFIRVAEQRTQKVLDDLKALSKCAHPAVYELTNDDIEKIFSAIDAAVKDARATMTGEKRFKLSASPEEVTRKKEDTVTRYMVNVLDKECDGDRDQAFIYAESEAEMLQKLHQEYPEDRWVIGEYEVQNVPAWYKDIDERPDKAPHPEGKSFKREEVENMGLADLDLSVNAYSALWRGGIQTVGDLVKLSEADLGKFRNIGWKSKDEIKNKLAALGLELRKEEQPVEGHTSAKSLDERIKSAESRAMKSDARGSEKDIFTK